MSCRTTRTIPHRTARPARVGRRARGFTFIEVMVVVVIIGMLAGAVTLKVKGHMDAAKVNRARSDIAVIAKAIEAHNLTNDGYPSNTDGLEVIDVQNKTDPWGRPYEYNSPAKDHPFEIYTLGADGRPGGDDADADIYSWQLGENR